MSILVFFIILAAADAFSPIGNIIMSSIGFFNPLLRVFKSFYSTEKNSNSGMKYSYIKHLGYEHLQSASNEEIESNIKEAKPKKIRKKLLFFPEEVDASQNKTYERILNNTSRGKSFYFVQNLINETNFSENSTSSNNYSNILILNKTN
ncbi:uncharacterized protein cubi_01410 [Cryptosporidium ubiquitum]|uniref:Uncharacterized protein n=1 Tax=Cryptosporidium ubiquitum TaxID=857276 RepID=A0A1J4MGU7_9CRYT|nr:uncharacterized protein cubi_01410 [Cryptosporidium ubiquitum]OII72077.1 hypothetical protein cubi_01410 [Cryptosporidium ubiquitum]